MEENKRAAEAAPTLFRATIYREEINPIIPGYILGAKLLKVTNMRNISYACVLAATTHFLNDRICTLDCIVKCLGLPLGEIVLAVSDLLRGGDVIRLFTDIDGNGYYTADFGLIHRIKARKEVQDGR